jgi:hypothetical protein
MAASALKARSLNYELNNLVGRWFIMTFDKLHVGLDNCNCRDHEGVREDSFSVFARLLRRETDMERVISFRISKVPDFWPTVMFWHPPVLLSKYEQVDGKDFESHHEIPIPLGKDLVTCAHHCKWRGVSINMLRNNNMERIREKYRVIRQHSKARVFGDYLCIFKLLDSAGLVCNDSPSHPLQHHNLLKSDSFCVKLVAVNRIEAID